MSYNAYKGISVRCKGFLFDLDGTLVDSVPVVERSWAAWAKRQGITPQDVLDFVHGRQAVMTLRHFMPDASETRIQEEFAWMEQLESEDVAGVVALPGANALLERLNQWQIPWAIVTSGSVPVAHARWAASELPKPAVFITAEQVARGKPEPDAYLLGAQKLALPPGECVVVEDAVAGILSGLSAGCQVIAVNVPQHISQQNNKVDLSITSLSELRLEKEGDWVVIQHQ